MLGYKYKDIQGFGSTLRLAELMAIDMGEPDLREGLMKIWDFFEGVLAEGYVEGEEVEEMSELITIATFCQEAECDKDIEVSAILYMPANRVEYICSYCGVGQGQDNWLEGARV